MLSQSDRRFTPRKGERGPLARVIVERIGDTGGGWYRPAFRTQDPAVDPQEPGGSDTSSQGTDHGWANCTMSAGAMVLNFHTLGSVDKWGGLLRHHQSDLEGGTDLYDLRDAWRAYGQELSIRSGSGWAAVEEDRRDGRAIVLQGEGGTPGAGTYTGGHAIAVLPETHSDGRWLIGNPECDGYEWVSPSQLRTWAQNWQSSIAYARSAPHKSGGSEKVGLRLTALTAWSGTVKIMFTGVSAIVVSDKSLVGLSKDTVKTGYMLAELDEVYGAWPMGTPVVAIGDDLAVVIRSQAELSDSDCDAEIADAVEARDHEWITHLTPD